MFVTIAIPQYFLAFFVVFFFLKPNPYPAHTELVPSYVRRKPHRVLCMWQSLLPGSRVLRGDAQLLPQPHCERRALPTPFTKATPDTCTQHGVASHPRWSAPHHCTSYLLGSSCDYLFSEHPSDSWEHPSTFSFFLKQLSQKQLTRPAQIT